MKWSILWINCNDMNLKLFKQYLFIFLKLKVPLKGFLRLFSWVYYFQRRKTQAVSKQRWLSFSVPKSYCCSFSFLWYLGSFWKDPSCSAPQTGCRKSRFSPNCRHPGKYECGNFGWSCFYKNINLPDSCQYGIILKFLSFRYFNVWILYTLMYLIFSRT